MAVFTDPHYSPALKAAFGAMDRGAQPNDPSTWAPDTKYDAARQQWRVFKPDTTARDEAAYLGQPLPELDGPNGKGEWVEGNFTPGLSLAQVVGGLAAGVAPTNSRALNTTTGLVSAYAPILSGIGAAGAGAKAAAGSTATSAAAKAGGSMSTGSQILNGFGGWGGLISTGLDVAGRVAGASSKGAAEGRLLESGDQLRRDALNQNAAEGNVKADSLRLRQAILMDMLSGMEDAKISTPANLVGHRPELSGGLRPSAMPGRADIGAAIRPRIMQALLTGNNIPNPMAAPQESGFDKFSNILGTATGYAGAFLPLLQKGRTTQPVGARPQDRPPTTIPGATGTMPSGVHF